MSAQFTYEHRTECLKGTVGKKVFNVYAASGGNRASTKLRDRVTRVTFDPAQPGAALPKGKCRLAFLGKPYKHYGDGAVLLWPEKKILERYKISKRTFNDFLIHAPGPVGSEGCIVPYRKSDAKALLKAFRTAFGKVDWTAKKDEDKWHGWLEVLDEPIEGLKYRILRTIETDEWKKAQGIDWEAA